MCSLQPGLKGISENIEAISIVDRYLEHPRLYVFYNAGAPEYLHRLRGPDDAQPRLPR
jgi:polyphosphate kinase